MARLSAAVMVLMLVAFGVLTDASALSCCRKYSKSVVPMSIIKGYSIQTMIRNCHIDAVIFHTRGGRNICADPSLTWVMNSIVKLREKVEQLNKKKENKASD